MKTAIYVENGVTQLVLTPESDWEKDVVARMVPGDNHTVDVKRGSFYETRGGWTRSSYPGFANEEKDGSLILRVTERKPEVVDLPTPTPEWCMETFYRVNPGAASSVPNMPSLYLMDFAMAVLAKFCGGSATRP